MEEKALEMFATLMTILTFGLVLGFAVQPLFAVRKKVRKEAQAASEALRLRKLSLYDQIKELELDYETGSISPADFHRSRSELKREVSQVLEQLRSVDHA